LDFDLSSGEFPLLTSKYTWFKGIKTELIWFLRGGDNVNWLQENGVRIWDEWADENGDLGPVYGSQWRSWKGANGVTIDQLSSAIDRIKTKPFDRRHIVSSWNAAEIEKMALPPCHLLYQFNVDPASDGGKDYLDCQLYQRSADLFLGVPFNIASYATLQSMVAQVTDKRPGKLRIAFGDTHIYTNHFRQFLIQLARDPYPAPELELNPEIKDIDDFGLKDIEVKNYNFHPTIKAPISV
jgi:thymidylate synthase